MGVWQLGGRTLAQLTIQVSTAATITTRIQTTLEAAIPKTTKVFLTRSLQKTILVSMTQDLIIF